MKVWIFIEGFKPQPCVTVQPLQSFSGPLEKSQGRWVGLVWPGFHRHKEVEASGVSHSPVQANRPCCNTSFLSKSRITAAWKQRGLQITTWKRVQVRDKHGFHLPGLLRCNIIIFRHSPSPFPKLLVGHTPAGFGDTWLKQQVSSENVQLPGSHS